MCRLTALLITKCLLLLATQRRSEKPAIMDNDAEFQTASPGRFFLFFFFYCCTQLFTRKTVTEIAVLRMKTVEILAPRQSGSIMGWSGREYWTSGWQKRTENSPFFGVGKLRTEEVSHSYLSRLHRPSLCSGDTSSVQRSEVKDAESKQTVRWT